MDAAVIERLARRGEQVVELARVSARALSDALRANRAVLEYRIAPTSD